MNCNWMYNEQTNNQDIANINNNIQLCICNLPTKNFKNLFQLTHNNE